MTPAPPLMTLDEYLETPETVKPTELIDGALRLAESPTARHQSAVLQLMRPLDAQPDLFFVSKRSCAHGEASHLRPPDLVIEVLSPHPRIGSAEERIGWFAEYGAQECWLVHQDDVTIVVIQFANGRVASRKRYRQDQPIVSTCCRTSSPPSTTCSATRFPEVGIARLSQRCSPACSWTLGQLTSRPAARSSDRLASPAARAGSTR